VTRTLCAAALWLGLAAGPAFAHPQAPIPPPAAPPTAEQTGGEQAASAEAEASPRPSPASPASGVPVYYRGRVVWRVFTPLGMLSAEDRARMVSERLDRLVRDWSISPEDLRLVEDPPFVYLMHRDQVLGALSRDDASASGVPQRQLAERVLTTLRTVMVETREELSLRSALTGIGLAAAATVVAALLLWLVVRLFQRLILRVAGWSQRHEKGIAIQHLTLVTPARLAAVATSAIRVARAVLVLVLAFAWLETVLSALPWSRPYARLVVDYLEEPLWFVWSGLIGVLPSLFYLFVIGAVAYAAIRGVHFLFREVERGTITLPGFPPEWAEPTYKLVRVLLVALAVVAAYPYIPGSTSPAFQGVSVFLGLLLSLSSSSAISNMVAGTILTYTGAFRIGDRVRIGETTGDIVQTSLLVTKVRTIKNVLVAVPNSLVLGGQILNFTTMARDQGLILNTAVTIGYDAPWRQVHELLVRAALATRGIVDEPAPFVLQTALNDFYVTYEINAFTRDPHRMVDIYSDLHANIQDAFNEAGVEIMSPHYGSLRDGNRIAIPDQYVAADYEAKAFRVTTPKDGGR